MNTPSLLVLDLARTTAGRLIRTCRAVRSARWWMTTGAEAGAGLGTELRVVVEFDDLTRAAYDPPRGRPPERDPS